jgi:hypothetical protein
VTLSWPSLRWLVRGLLPTLMHHAACVNRSSAAGRAVVAALADGMQQLGAAMGPAFAAHALRPMLLRGLGVPCETPPALEAPAVASQAAATAAALGAGVPGGAAGPAGQLMLALSAPGAKGRSGPQRACILLAQALLGVPATSDEARRAFAARSLGDLLRDAGLERGEDDGEWRRRLRAPLAAEARVFIRGPAFTAWLDALLA